MCHLYSNTTVIYKALIRQAICCHILSGRKRMYNHIFSLNCLKYMTRDFFSPKKFIVSKVPFHSVEALG